MTGDELVAEIEQGIVSADELEALLPPSIWEVKRDGFAYVVDAASFWFVPCACGCFSRKWPS